MSRRESGTGPFTSTPGIDYATQFIRSCISFYTFSARVPILRSQWELNEITDSSYWILVARELDDFLGRQIYKKPNTDTNRLTK